METRDEIIKAIQYAKQYTPHKVAYYEELLKTFDAMKNIPSPKQ